MDENRFFIDALIFFLLSSPCWAVIVCFAWMRIADATLEVKRNKERLAREKIRLANEYDREKENKWRVFEGNDSLLSPPPPAPPLNF